MSILRFRIDMMNNDTSHKRDIINNRHLLNERNNSLRYGATKYKSARVVTAAPSRARFTAPGAQEVQLARSAREKSLPRARRQNRALSRHLNASEN